MEYQISNIKYQKDKVNLVLTTSLRSGHLRNALRGLPLQIHDLTIGALWYGVNIKKAKIFNFLYVFLIFNILFFIFLPHVGGLTHAQSYSLSISPSLMELIIKPGKTITQEFKLINYGDPTIVTPQIIPLSLADENLKLNEPFFLDSNEKKSLILKIAVPDDAENGDQYLFFSLQSKNPPADNSNSSIIETSIGANILLTISDINTLNKTAKIQSMDFPVIIDSFDPLEGVIKIQNTGSSFLKPVGKLTLQGPLFQSDYTLLPQNILSGTSRVVKTTLDLDKQSLSPTDKTISLHGFFLGPYTSSVALHPDGTSLNLQKSVRVLAVPWKALLIIASIIFLVYLYKRK